MPTKPTGVVNLKEKDRLCFPFCSDLSNKEIHGVDLDDQINIKWALFRLRQLPDMFGGPGGIKDTEILIPGSYFVEKVKPDDWTSLLTKSEQYDVFVAPSNYYEDKCLFKTWRQELTINLPNELIEQPHLYKHSTFQFYHLKNVIFFNNLAYMNIDENSKIRAIVDISVSPAGTYFVFQSGEIPFKWKLDVRQGIVTWNLVRDTIDAVQNTVKSIGSGILKALSLGAIDASKTKKPMEKLTKDLMTGKDGFKSMGLDREKINKTQELQTQRLFTSTSLTGESMLEPSVFHSNSVQFPYNLYDFALRSFTPRYEARIYISKTLFNNLKHNNNENPITYPLNITFEKLGHILRPGFIQGRLDLDYDPGGKMAECFARGVTFYNDKKEHFVNPDLGIAPVNSQVVRSGIGIDSYTAQAIQSGDESWTNEINRTKGSNYHQRAHYFITYEDGSKDHWCVKFPTSFTDNDLADGHSRGGFDLKFNKPVKEFIDVYSCIGCGASGKKGETAPEQINRDIPGYGFANDLDFHGDNLDHIIKGIPWDPYFEWLTTTHASTTNSAGWCPGSTGDVWEFTGQYIRGKDNKPFTEAYGFIPQGGTIRWTTKGGGSTRLEWQKQPSRDDFDALDWSPPAGSGGELEIPLSDPEINIPEPGEGDIVPDNDFPEVDPFDPSGGEPEIPPIEPDIPPDIDPADPDEFPDIDPPSIEPDPPEVDPSEPDPGQDPDPTDVDPGDNDPGGDDEDGD
ncbi:hypothetical protein [endosymbiont GvMRE of Glomus versiforme]|uniref:hypothetical protein n=1 Tax=endosymbiont GvMRE of Glomus versiforme TaxID=2039283 RepID=UPI000EE265A8|nr:hypothetical protein [endosymbiont GvMRE of Glomus versiforme]RHZ37265.1 hypothetical protein GvMRE_I1g102 [endosymbiont GvMRE of Glomus versiforme]